METITSHGQKTALVTGSAAGIGLEVSRTLVERGFRVLMTDQDEVAGRASAESLGADFHSLDVTDEKAWREVESYLTDHYGRLDVLVNNAGIYAAGTIEEAKVSDWQRVQGVNVIGVLLGCQTAIRLMKHRGGSIVNMSSGAALRPGPGAAVYSATKSAVWNLTRTTALHCAREGYGIRCNSVHPGMVDTQMVSGRVDTEEARELLYREADALHPLGRVATPEDIASAVAFLASEESAYMTGIALPVDGGYAIA